MISMESHGDNRNNGAFLFFFLTNATGMQPSSLGNNNSDRHQRCWWSLSVLRFVYYLPSCLLLHWHKCNYVPSCIWNTLLLPFTRFSFISGVLMLLLTLFALCFLCGSSRLHARSYVIAYAHTCSQCTWPRNFTVLG